MATFTHIFRSKSQNGTLKWMFTVVLCYLCVISKCLGKDLYCQSTFTHCICNEDVVECHDEGKLANDLHDLYPMIKDHVKNITITGSNFPETPANIFGSCRSASDLVLNDLKYVDLSSNNIKIVHGKTFHCLPNLETLILRDNQWQIDRNSEQIGYFTSLPSLKHLDLTDTFEDVWDGTIHVSKLSRIFYETDMTNLEVLKLSHNEFNSLAVVSANSFCELTKLKHLDLSHNNFSIPSMPDKTNCFAHLETLDFSSNKIRYLSKEFMEEIDAVYTKYHSFQTILMDDNPFICDCDLKETWKWLNQTKVPVNKYDMRCQSGYHSSYNGKRILDLNLDDLKCDEQFAQQSHTGTTVVIALIFVVIAATIVGFMVVNRARVKICVRNFGKKIPALRSHVGYKSVQEVATI